MTLRNTLMGSIACAVLAGLVACGGDNAPPTYTVGGTLAGSVGPVVLKLNGAGDMSLATPGAFTFTTALLEGVAFSVTASGAQNCRVVNGSGTVAAANITNVTITCTTVVRSASLSGTQESPPNASTASGRGAVVVNPATREITGGVTFSGVTPSTGGHHIHQAPSGTPTLNGPVIIPLTLAPGGGGVATVPTGTVLTEAQYTAFLAGELYFNIHSAANPGGEIRGQINVSGGVTAGLATLNSAQEVPLNTSTATGRGTIVFDSTTRDILIAYATHNVVNTTVAHIHTGAPGVSGPANVVTLASGTNVFTAPRPTTLTTQNVTDINAGNTYFNLHSTAFPGGEIRGQIAVQ